MVFLSCAVVLAVALIAALLVVTVKPKAGPALSPPQFTAEREPLTRGSYRVRVTHLRGAPVEETTCLLEGYMGRLVTPLPEAFRPGQSLSVIYTPALSDDIPTHVRVEWKQGSRRKSSLVPIA